MAGTVPTVFVSSTFYDLEQIRADLGNFLDSLGMTPLLSEYASFPVDPSISNVENCRKAVRDFADILVLIVGGRYGSIDLDSNKSITNLELIEAQAKGIPIFVFVLEKILDSLSAWRDNREGNFTSVVDSPRLFEFVSDLYTSPKTWVIPFRQAQDICSSLKVRLAQLFFNDFGGLASHPAGRPASSIVRA